MTIAGILVVVLPWCYWPRQGTRRRVVLNAYRVGFALPATPCLAVIPGGGVILAIEWSGSGVRRKS